MVVTVIDHHGDDVRHESGTAWVVENGALQITSDRGDVGVHAPGAWAYATTDAEPTDQGATPPTA